MPVERGIPRRAQSIREGAGTMKLGARRTSAASNPALFGYLVFTVSWFLHLPARIPFLGLIRFDLILVAILAVAALNRKSEVQESRRATEKWLIVLVAYALVTVPFVEWPGSALKVGLPNFVKAVVFYYFTVAFLRTERELRAFILVFLACQVLRVLEPLYLHLTTGYWGSQASMGGGNEFLDRLSGGPFDVVNPNGLAFIVCTALPLLYFLARTSVPKKLAVWILISALLYALALTGSRSGLIGLAIVATGVLIKSTNKAVVATSITAIAVAGFLMLGGDMQDRYLSILGKGEKNQATAQERIEGMRAQYTVVLHRPIFGHGLGTSAEANYHFSADGPYGGRAMPAHNVFIEVAQELGLIGLGIFLAFLVSVVLEFARLNLRTAALDQRSFHARLLDGMQVWVAMSLVFSFASYGLSNYDWYLFAGLAVVLHRQVAAGHAQPVAGASAKRFARARRGGEARV